MHLVLLFLGLILLSGCASNPIPAEKAAPAPPHQLFAHQQIPSEPHGRLRITRDRGFTGSACPYLIYINGKHSASIWAGETARFYLPVGQHIIGVNSAAWCGGGLKERQQEIKANDELRMRASIDSAMSMDLSPTAF